MGRWLARILNEGKLPKAYSPEAWCAREWGLHRPMPDPDNTDISQVNFLDVTEFPHFPTWDDLDEYFTNDDADPKTDKILVGFNLIEPLTLQIKRAYEKLRRLKGRLETPRTIDGPETRNRGDKWVTFLRILDARNQEIPPRYPEIADVLFRGSRYAVQKAQRHYSAAEETTRKKRYLNILRSPID